MCLEIAPFLAPVAFACCLNSGSRPLRICSAATATFSSSRGVSLRSSRIAALRTSSRIFFESSVVIWLTRSGNIPPASVARVLERRHRLLLGPVREAAGPEVVVLVEALVPALREVVAAPLQPAFECGEGLLAVDLDALGLALDLVLELVQVLLRAATSTAVTIEAAK